MATRRVQPKMRATDIRPESFQLKRNIEMLMEGHKDTPGDIIRLLDICEATYYNRQREPWTWLSGELEVLAQHWDITISDLYEIPKFMKPLFGGASK